MQTTHLFRIVVCLMALGVCVSAQTSLLFWIIRAVSKFCTCVSSSALCLCCCWLNVLLWCNIILSWLDFFFCLFQSVSCDYTSLLSVVFAAPVSIQIKPDLKLCLKATPYLWRGLPSTQNICSTHALTGCNLSAYGKRLCMYLASVSHLSFYGVCWFLCSSVSVFWVSFAFLDLLILKLFIFDWFLIYVLCFGFYATILLLSLGVSSAKFEIILYPARSFLKKKIPKKWT